MGKTLDRLILKRIMLIFLGIGLCVCFEIIARFILPEDKLNLLESIHTVCLEDDELLWRQKSNLNTMFQGKYVRTDTLGLRDAEIVQRKKEHMYRVICLGDSSTFGWGVDEGKTYPADLQFLLNEHLAQKAIEVINAGQIGYSSYQGKIFLKKYLLDLSPDIVTVSYVLNDIDKIRFFNNRKLADSQIPMVHSKLMGIKNYIMDKRIYFLAKRFTLWLMRNNQQLSAIMYKNYYENSKIRVSNLEYRENLQDIIALCKAKNIKLVFIIMPINLTLPEISPGENGSNLSHEYYQKAISLLKNREYKNAALFFKKALDYQVFVCKNNGVLYQNIMLKVAQENNIPLVNAAESFDDYQAERKVSLFNGANDRIHPSASGHRIIANALYESIVNNALLLPLKNKEN
jgi:lysophospholipase L1-like esterase